MDDLSPGDLVWIGVDQEPGEIISYVGWFQISGHQLWLTDSVYAVRRRSSEVLLCYETELATRPWEPGDRAHVTSDQSMATVESRPYWGFPGLPTVLVRDDADGGLRETFLEFLR